MLIRTSEMNIGDQPKPVSVLRRPGGHGEEPEPDPIPNSAVKLLRANGTLS
jgi:hypothetical protein